MNIYQTNLKELCLEKGINRQLTIPITLQQNGVTERRNRTLLEMVRSMMTQANLPISFCGDALLVITRFFLIFLRQLLL